MAGEPIEQLTTALVAQRRRYGHAARGELGERLLEYGAQETLLWAQRSRWPPLRSQGSKQLTLPVVGRVPGVPRHAIRPPPDVPILPRMSIPARDVTVTRGRRSSPFANDGAMAAPCWARSLGAGTGRAVGPARHGTMRSSSLSRITRVWNSRHAAEAGSRMSPTQHPWPRPHAIVCQPGCAVSRGTHGGSGINR